MLSHPDPQTQVMFSLLERQRDDAMIAAANEKNRADGLQLEVDALMKKVAELTPPPAPAEPPAAEAAPDNVVQLPDVNAA